MKHKLGEIQMIVSNDVCELLEKIYKAEKQIDEGQGIAHEGAKALVMRVLPNRTAPVMDRTMPRGMLIS